MRRLLFRFTIIFLVFWGGLSIRDCADPLRQLWAMDSPYLQLTLLKGELEIADTRLMQKKMTLYKECAKHPIDALRKTPRFAQLEAENSKLEERVQSLKRDIAAQEEELVSQAESGGRDMQQSLWSRCRVSAELLLAALSAEWRRALLSAIGLLGAALALKLAAYYLVAPWLEKWHGITLNRSDHASCLPQLGSDARATKLLTLTLAPGETLTVRDEDYTGGYTDTAGEDRLIKRTQWLFSLRSALMSLCCGLTLMIRFENRTTGKRTHEIRITSDDPDEYFTSLRVDHERPLYITPSDLVAFSDGIRITACWRLFSLPAWCMGQIRYYSLSGTGRVVLRSQGGMTHTPLTPERDSICKKHSVICATCGVGMHIRRTETLVPYLLGKSSLFDLRLYGSGSFLMRNALVKPTSAAQKAGHFLMEGLGKFFGF